MKAYRVVAVETVTYDLWVEAESFTEARSAALELIEEGSAGDAGIAVSDGVTVVDVSL